MLTLQSLAITAVVLLALCLIIGAGLYWRDNKTKVNVVIWRVARLLLALVALPIVLVVYLAMAACIVLAGGFSLIFRILTGRSPHSIRVKVTFDQ